MIPVHGGILPPDISSTMTRPTQQPLDLVSYFAGQPLADDSPSERGEPFRSFACDAEATIARSDPPTLAFEQSQIFAAAIHVGGKV
jgi:hypothetical protein